MEDFLIFAAVLLCIAVAVAFWPLWVALILLFIICYAVKKHKETVAEKLAKEKALEEAHAEEMHRQQVKKVQDYIIEFNRAYSLNITPFLSLLDGTGTNLEEHTLYQKQTLFNKNLHEVANKLNKYVDENGGTTHASFHII